MVIEVVNPEWDETGFPAIVLIVGPTDSFRSSSFQYSFGSP